MKKQIVTMILFIVSSFTIFSEPLESNYDLKNNGDWQINIKIVNDENWIFDHVIRYYQSDDFYELIAYVSHPTLAIQSQYTDFRITNMPTLFDYDHNHFGMVDTIKGELNDGNIKFETLDPENLGFNFLPYMGLLKLFLGIHGLGNAIYEAYNNSILSINELEQINVTLEFYLEIDDKYKIIKFENIEDIGIEFMKIADEYDLDEYGFYM